MSMIYDNMYVILS